MFYKQETSINILQYENEWDGVKKLVPGKDRIMLRIRFNQLLIVHRFHKAITTGVSLVNKRDFVCLLVAEKIPFMVQIL